MGRLQFVICKTLCFRSEQVKFSSFGKELTFSGMNSRIPRSVSEIRMPPQWPVFFKKNCDLDIWPWPRQMTLTLVLKKGFTPRNIYVKYESCITYHSKAMANVKVFSDKHTERRPKTICPWWRRHKNLHVWSGKINVQNADWKHFSFSEQDFKTFHFQDRLKFRAMT